jgi:hypothetical protein
LPETNEDEMDQLILSTINASKPESVQQLVNLMREKSAEPEQKMLDRIQYLQKTGKIHLEASRAPGQGELTGCLRSDRVLWYWATWALTLSTVVVTLTIPENAFPFVYLRYVLGLVFVLWLPGYAFVRALFPSRLSPDDSKENFDVIERIAYSVGLSLALVPLTGLVLNYTPFGIRLAPIVLSLTALTLVFATVAVAREHVSVASSPSTQNNSNVQAGNPNPI